MRPRLLEVRRCTLWRVAIQWTTSKALKTRWLAKCQALQIACELHSKLWLNSQPNVRRCKVLGTITGSRCWLKLALNSKLVKPLGSKVTSSRARSYATLNFRLCRLLGQVTRSRLWLNPSPNVRLTAPRLGKVTCSRLSLNSRPSVKLCILARSLPEGFDESRWTSPQMSSLTNCLGKWPIPGSHWMPGQISRFANCSAMSRVQGPG